MKRFFIGLALVGALALSGYIDVSISDTREVADCASCNTEEPQVPGDGDGIRVANCKGC